MTRGWALPVLLCAACSSSPASPAPPVPTTAALSGVVTVTNGGQPLAGASIDAGGQHAVTTTTGAFTLNLASASRLAVMVSGSGIVPRVVSVTPGTVALDALSLSGGFDLAYFRQLARDAYDQPDALRAIAHLARAPRIYIRTVDDANRPIDQTTLDVVTAAFNDVAAVWTGGRFGVAGFDYGPDTRAGVSGYITVRWMNESNHRNCGVADVGLDGGTILFNPVEPNCGCLGSAIAPTVARHELGHAYGMRHTGAVDDVMFPTPQMCDLSPSARERTHAAIVYARPVGNVDPDTDP